MGTQGTNTISENMGIHIFISRASLRTLFF
jgi:hypothetical protein